MIQLAKLQMKLRVSYEKLKLNELFMCVFVVPVEYQHDVWLEMPDFFEGTVTKHANLKLLCNTLAMEEVKFQAQFDEEVQSNLENAVNSTDSSVQRKKRPQNSSKDESVDESNRAKKQKGTNPQKKIFFQMYAFLLFKKKYKPSVCWCSPYSCPGCCCCSLLSLKNHTKYDMLKI